MPDHATTDARRQTGDAGWVYSQPTPVIRWQTAESNWTQEKLDQTFPFESGDGEWQSAFGVVTVPDDVGRLIVLLNVTGQITDVNVCWFDNLGVYRLRP